MYEVKERVTFFQWGQIKRTGRFSSTYCRCIFSIFFIIKIKNILKYLQAVIKYSVSNFGAIVMHIENIVI